MYAIGLWALAPLGSVREQMLTAVNAGGDCDSTAAMCGALHVAASAGLGLPEEWRVFRPEHLVQAERLAHLLAP